MHLLANLAEGMAIAMPLPVHNAVAGTAAMPFSSYVGKGWNIAWPLPARLAESWDMALPMQPHSLIQASCLRRRCMPKAASPQASPTTPQLALAPYTNTLILSQPTKIYWALCM